MKDFRLAVVVIIFCVVFDCRAEFLCSRLNRCATSQSNCFYNVKTVFSGRGGALLGNLVLMTSNTIVNIAKDNVVIYPEVECCLRPLSAAGMKRLQTKAGWCCLYDITEYSSHERFDKVESCDCKDDPIPECDDSSEWVKEKEDDSADGLNELLRELQTHHGIIFKAGLLALREGSAIKGRLIPITRNANEDATFFTYAIAVRDSYDKRIGIKFWYEIFKVRGDDVICQGGGVCSYKVELSNSEIVDMIATGVGKVGAQINDSIFSFTLIWGSKSRRIQFGAEDVKAVLTHICDTMPKRTP